MDSVGGWIGLVVYVYIENIEYGWCIVEVLDYGMVGLNEILILFEVCVI